MLKTDEGTMGLYRCIKEHEDEDPISKMEYKYFPKEVIMSFKDPGEDFVKIGTYRRAFIGDMQKRLNTAYGENLMEKYAKQKNLFVERNIVYRTEKVYIKQNIFKQFHEYILSLFRKKRKSNDEEFYLEDLYGQR